MRRVLQLAALTASPALVFGLTLRPGGGPNRVELAPWTTQQLNADNVVLAIPGRTTATVDVLCNTFGAAAGWLLARECWG